MTMKITRKNELIYKYDDFGLIVSGILLIISILILADGLSYSPYDYEGDFTFGGLSIKLALLFFAVWSLVLTGFTFLGWLLVHLRK